MIDEEYAGASTVIGEEDAGRGGLAGRIVDYLAGAVTILFHPVFLPLYGLYLLFNIPALFVFLPGQVRRVIFLMVLVNNVILPLVLLPLFKLRGIITSYDLEKRTERIIPLMTTSLMYFVTAVMIYRFQLPGMVKSFLFASACVVLATALLNFRWKVSVHAVGVGAMVATVLVLSFRMYAGMPGIVVIVFIVSGLVLSSRLWLRAHTPEQIYTGFLAGSTIMGLGLMI
jgi:hypothetical protein